MAFIDTQHYFGCVNTVITASLPGAKNSFSQFYAGFSESAIQ
jgi:hypothetical protein